MITNVMPQPSDAFTRQEPVPAKHLLPPLPYEYAALEPHIDARTTMLHHDKHHASYVEKLNAALEGFPELQGRTAIWLLLNLIQVPREIRADVRNNAGGHVNHSLFWRAMCPTGSGTPAGPLADAIVREFGSVEQLKTRGNVRFSCPVLGSPESKPVPGRPGPIVGLTRESRAPDGFDHHPRAELAPFRPAASCRPTLHVRRHG
jgi:hypothetical protein